MKVEHSEAVKSDTILSHGPQVRTPQSPKGNSGPLTHFSASKPKIHKYPGSGRQKPLSPVVAVTQCANDGNLSGQNSRGPLPWDGGIVASQMNCELGPFFHSNQEIGN